MAMAFSHWLLVVTCIDQGGNEVNLKYFLTGVEADLIADMLADQSTILGRLGNVTDLAVKAAHLSYVSVDSAAGFGTGEAENVALITADIDGQVGKTANIRVPAPSSGIFKGVAGKDWNTVDTADADIIAYLSTFETGGLATVSDGETIKDSATSGNWYGKRIHRGSRVG